MSWCFTEIALPLYDEWEEKKLPTLSIDTSVGKKAVRLMEEPMERLELAWKLFVATTAADMPLDIRPVHCFRVLDDDGTVYAYGRSDDDSSFDPLDEYAAGAWGCTRIEYKNDKDEWEEL